MKRSTMARTCGFSLAGVAVVALVFWERIADRFLPTKHRDSQCLICSRQRDQRWVCGWMLKDKITTNVYSEWIDTFTPLGHQHVWATANISTRDRWFGSMMVGCGGNATISRIYKQRGTLGEQKCQQLVVKFQELARQPNSENKDLERNC